MYIRWEVSEGEGRWVVCEERGEESIVVFLFYQVVKRREGRNISRTCCQNVGTCLDVDIGACTTVGGEAWEVVRSRGIILTYGSMACDSV